MKTENEIKNELAKQYQHRLELRLERKMKNCCRNCKAAQVKDFNLGDFGDRSWYFCKDGKSNPKGDCQGFDCLYTPENIEDELLEDLKDPAVSGAKEPKIAALMWVLHNSHEDVPILQRLKNALFGR